MKPSLTLEAVQAVWPQIHNALRVRKNRSLQAFLLEGSPEAVQEDLITLTFPDKYDLHRKKVDSERELLETILGTCLGLPVRVRCVLKSAYEAQPGAEGAGPMFPIPEHNLPGATVSDGAMARARAEMEQLEHQVREMEARFEKRTNTLLAVEEDIREQEWTRQETIRRLDAREASLHREICELEKARAQLDLQTRAAKEEANQIKALPGVLEKLQSQKAAIQQETEALRQERLSIERALKVLRAEKAAAEQGTAGLRTEKAALEREISGLREQNPPVKKEVEGLQARKSAAQKEVLALEAQLPGLRQEVDTLRARKTKLEGELRELERRQGAMADEESKLRTAIAAANKQRNQEEDTLTKRLRQLQAQVAQLETQERELAGRANAPGQRPSPERAESRPDWLRELIGAQEMAHK